MIDMALIYHVIVVVYGFIGLMISVAGRVKPEYEEKLSVAYLYLFVVISFGALGFEMYLARFGYGQA